MSRRIERAIPRACVLLALAACAGCTGTRLLTHPTVQLQTAGGTELGVSTEYGVVFLGSTARAGAVELTAWYGDGPSIESTVIEPVGGGLYTAETEIRLPSVPLRFDDPLPGETLLVIGVARGRFWEEEVKVRSDPRVEGILIDIPRELRDAPEQVGAGVFWLPEGDDRKNMRLVGLVAGRVALAREGDAREFLAVVGPRTLWRLVAHRRDPPSRARWIYREDVL